MPATENPKMVCIVCEKHLEREYSPTQPIHGVSFSGGPAYGSEHDLEQREYGLQYFEIFLCDECWDKKRHLCVGVKRTRPQPEYTYFDGAEVIRARKASRAAHRCVDIEHLDDPPDEDEEPRVEIITGEDE